MLIASNESPGTRNIYVNSSFDDAFYHFSTAKDVTEFNTLLKCEMKFLMDSSTGIFLVHNKKLKHKQFLIMLIKFSN